MLKLIILGNFISGLICGIILMIIIARKEKKIVIEDLLLIPFCLMFGYLVFIAGIIWLLNSVWNYFLKKWDKIKDNIIIDFSEKIKHS